MSSACVPEILVKAPVHLILGFALEALALFCYSLLTQAALGATSPSPWRLFRIQLSTRAVASLMPGGSAAGSALGYRLLTASGVPAADAGFAEVSEVVLLRAINELVEIDRVVVFFEVFVVKVVIGLMADRFQFLFEQLGVRPFLLDVLSEEIE